MKKQQIRRWYDNKILYETDVEDDDPNPIRTAVDRASLDRASLDRASLDGASLDGASLDGASLDRASLDGASLDGASLDNIKADFRAVLDQAPNEVLGLLSALRGGRIDGSCYEGACACLLGTIANARRCNYKQLGDLRPDAGRLAERWFLALRPGATPSGHPVARITERWILEWMQEHDVADPRVALRAIAEKVIATADISADELRSLGIGALEMMA